MRRAEALVRAIARNKNFVVQVEPHRNEGFNGIRHCQTIILKFADADASAFFWVWHDGQDANFALRHRSKSCNTNGTPMGILVSIAKALREVSASTTYPAAS